MEEKAAFDVRALLLVVTRSMFLDINDVEYYVMASLMIFMPTKELKEFRVIFIWQASEEFRHLMLMRMLKEAKLLQADLKPHYLQEADPYNMSIPDEEDDVYSPIQLGLPLRIENISPPKGELNAKSRIDPSGTSIKEPIRLTCIEIQ